MNSLKYLFAGNPRKNLAKKEKRKKSNLVKDFFN